MLWWLSPGEGRDAVGINCKTAATTENQGADVKYIGYGLRGLCFMIVCVCVIRLDTTTPHWWREKVVVYYYYLMVFILKVKTLKMFIPTDI